MKKHKCRLKDLGQSYHSPRNEELRYCTVCEAGYYVGDKTPTGATVVRGSEVAKPVPEETLPEFVPSVEGFGTHSSEGAVAEAIWEMKQEDLPEYPESPSEAAWRFIPVMSAMETLEQLGYKVTLEHKDMRTYNWGTPPQLPNVPTGFVKHDTGKTRFSLVPPAARLEVAKVFTHGGKKYPPHNYRLGTEWSRYIDALYRHMNDFELGQNVDEESGLLTLAHVAACAMILLELQKINKGMDDRT